MLPLKKYYLFIRNGYPEKKIQKLLEANMSTECHGNSDGFIFKLTFVTENNVGLFYLYFVHLN